MFQWWKCSCLGWYALVCSKFIWATSTIENRENYKWRRQDSPPKISLIIQRKAKCNQQNMFLVWLLNTSFAQNSPQTRMLVSDRYRTARGQALQHKKRCLVSQHDTEYSTGALSFTGTALGQARSYHSE